MNISIGGVAKALASPVARTLNSTLGAVPFVGQSEQLESGDGIEARPTPWSDGIDSGPSAEPDGFFHRARELAESTLGRIPRDAEPAYKQEAGPHGVTTHRETFHDEIRGRKIPMVVYSPEGVEDGTSPVVVMSHGLGGNSWTYRYFGQHLASHGYTVVQPTHVGSDTLGTLKRTPMLAFGKGELVDRVKDVRFALDLLESGRLPGEVSDKTDLDKVALAGHSFGALTAQAMAGLAVRDKDGADLELKDKRISAFVAMSPYGDSFPSKWLGLDTESYDRIEQPILYMSGEKDRIFTLGKGPKIHQSPYDRTGTDDKVHLTIGGGYHASFAQVLGAADRNTSELTASTTTAFLDAHLSGDVRAQGYLNDDLARVAKSRDSEALVGPTNSDL